MIWYFWCQFWTTIYNLWGCLDSPPINLWFINPQPWAHRCVFWWPDGIPVYLWLWYSLFLWWREFFCVPGVFRQQSSRGRSQWWWSIFFAKRKLSLRNIFKGILLSCAPGSELFHCTKTCKINKISNGRTGNHTPTYTHHPFPSITHQKILAQDLPNIYDFHFLVPAMRDY